MGRVRRFLGRLASRIESLILPDRGCVPPLHLRWRYYRTLRRDILALFAAATAGQLLADGLAPHHRVLDCGSGLGPLALGLIPHLTEGSYDGFDVHAEAVAWCRRAITPRHPRFRFRHADLFNSVYNPRGTRKAQDYRFPYDDASFDFAFLGSLCTHLTRADTSHYLRETARVLRPGGKCVASFYLLNENSLRAIDAGTSSLSFVHPDGTEGSRVVDRRNPESAVAHPETVIRNLFASVGMHIEEPIHRGRWPDGAAHQQDVVKAVKGSPAVPRPEAQGYRAICAL